MDVSKMMKAVFTRNLLEICLITQANPNILRSQSFVSGQTVLMLATWQGTVDVVNMLLDLGADVNGLSSYGSTALHVAVSEGNIEMVETLLRAGAIPNLQDKEDQTPLHVAYSSQDPEIIAMLLQFGANLDVSANKENDVEGENTSV